MKKRVLSLLLAMALLMSLVPVLGVPASAAGSFVKATSLSVGDKVVFVFSIVVVNEASADSNLFIQAPISDFFAAIVLIALSTIETKPAAAVDEPNAVVNCSFNDLDSTIPELVSTVSGVAPAASAEAFVPKVEESTFVNMLLSIYIAFAVLSAFAPTCILNPLFDKPVEPSPLRRFKPLKFEAFEIRSIS